MDQAKKTLKDLGLEAEISGDGSVVKTIKPYPGYTVKQGSKITLYTNDEGGDANSIVMPNLEGYSSESAEELLKALGINYTVTGTGVVYTQSIPAGEVIMKNVTVKLELNSQYKD